MSLKGDKEIPEQYAKKRLREICTYSKGKKPKVLSSEIKNEINIPYINIKAFEKGIFDEYTDGEKCNLCEDGDLLMVWDGARAGFSGKAKKGAVGSTLMKIEPKEEVLKNYLFYFLLSLYKKLNTNPRGVGIPHVEPALLWNSELIVPPLAEQQSIVSKIEELFSELDNSVAQISQAQQQLKTYRQIVLKAAFEGRLTEGWRKSNGAPRIELEPQPVNVRNLMGQQHQNSAKTNVIPLGLEPGAPIKNKNMDKVSSGFKPGVRFPYGVDNLQLAAEPEVEYQIKNELPEGWKWVKSKDVIDVINNGYTPKKEFLSEGSGDVPFIKVYNLNFDGSLNYSKNPTFIPKHIHDKDLKRSVCYPGDVLINIVGPPLGKVSIVSNQYPEWNINQAIVLFRPNDKITSKFLSFYLQSTEAINWLENTSKATAGQWNVKVSTCREIPIPLPSIKEQDAVVLEIESRLSVADNLKQNITQSLQQAEALRQSILKQAFEGKLV